MVSPSNSMVRFWYLQLRDRLLTLINLSVGRQLDTWRWHTLAVQWNWHMVYGAPNTNGIGHRPADMAALATPPKRVFFYSTQMACGLFLRPRDGKGPGLRWETTSADRWWYSDDQPHLPATGKWQESWGGALSASYQWSSDGRLGGGLRLPRPDGWRTRSDVDVGGVTVEAPCHRKMGESRHLRRSSTAATF